jgi:hypothetical protein
MLIAAMHQGGVFGATVACTKANVNGITFDLYIRCDFDELASSLYVRARCSYTRGDVGAKGGLGGELDSNRGSHWLHRVHPSMPCT